MHRIISYARPAQYIAALATGSVPIWIQTVLDENSTYWYLTTYPIIVQTASIAIVIILLPQILAYLIRALRTLLSLTFYSSYQAFRAKSYIIIPTVILWFIAAFCTASFLHGVSNYAFTVARELKHHSWINRQALVSLANQMSTSGHGAESASPVLRQIIASYPGSRYNDPIIDHLARIDQAKSVARKLALQADENRLVGRDMIAASLSRAALNVWPESIEGASTAHAINQKLDDSTPYLSQLFMYCSGDSTIEIDHILPSLGFVIRDPVSISRLSRSSQPEWREKISLFICSSTTDFANADDFIGHVRESMYIPIEELRSR